MPRVLLLDFSKTTLELKESLVNLLPGPVVVDIDRDFGKKYHYVIVSSHKIIYDEVDVSALKLHAGTVDCKVIAISSDVNTFCKDKVKDVVDVCLDKVVLLDPNCKKEVLTLLQQAI